MVSAIISAAIRVGKLVLAHGTQRIKGMHEPDEDATTAGRKAVMGAL
jgi:hypothetical protein